MVQALKFKEHFELFAYGDSCNGSIVTSCGPELYSTVYGEVVEERVLVAYCCLLLVILAD